MAEADIWVDPDGRYVDVYPVSTRLLAVANMVVRSQTAFPPENDPAAREVAAASDGAVEDGFQEYEDGTLLYSDNANAFASSRSVGESDIAVSVSLVYFDLTGLPADDYERAEFIISAQAQDSSVSDSDYEWIIEAYHETHSGPGGEPGDPDSDDYTSSPTAIDLIAPPITLGELADVGEGRALPGYPNEEYDEAFWGVQTDQWALPLTNLSAYQPGAFVGFRGRVIGSGTPSGRNSASAANLYNAYDSLIGSRSLWTAGHLLPHIRLWLPEAVATDLPIVDVAGEITIGLEIGGALSVDAGPPVFHRAKLVRGY